jgi:hypothetical protein
MSEPSKPAVEVTDPTPQRPDYNGLEKQALTNVMNAFDGVPNLANPREGGPDIILKPTKISLPQPSDRPVIAQAIEGPGGENPQPTNDPIRFRMEIPGIGIAVAADKGKAVEALNGALSRIPLMNANNDVTGPFHGDSPEKAGEKLKAVMQEFNAPEQDAKLLAGSKVFSNTAWSYRQGLTDRFGTEEEANPNKPLKYELSFAHGEDGVKERNAALENIQERLDAIKTYLAGDAVHQGMLEKNGLITADEAKDLQGKLVLVASKHERWGAPAIDIDIGYAKDPNRKPETAADLTDAGPLKKLAEDKREQLDAELTKAVAFGHDTGKQYAQGMGWQDIFPVFNRPEPLRELEKVYKANTEKALEGNPEKLADFQQKMNNALNEDVVKGMADYHAAQRDKNVKSSVGYDFLSGDVVEVTLAVPKTDARTKAAINSTDDAWKMIATEPLLPVQAKQAPAQAATATPENSQTLATENTATQAQTAPVAQSSTQMATPAAETAVQSNTSVLPETQIPVGPATANELARRTAATQAAITAPVPSRPI